MTNSQNTDDLRSLPQPWCMLLPFAVRIFVWGMFFAVLYILRSFFLLIFLTFVFSYIQSSGIRKLAPYIANRVLRVLLVAVVFLSSIITVGLYLGPRVQQQAAIFLDKMPSYVQAIDREIVDLSEAVPLAALLFPTIEHPSQPIELKNSPTIYFIEQLIGPEKQHVNDSKLEQVINAAREFGGSVISVISAFLLALLFSFLIILDTPSLTKNLSDLKHTRVAFVYNEVADSIFNFSRVLGHAFEAQLVIALINTFLTSIGINLLGLGGQVAFLSLIVFFCSFVPIVGVFISSVPICLVALQESGINLVLLCVLLIIIIHLIEGYILNPRVYGSHMRLNPVIVLMILTIGGKLFHIWGFILGIPIFTYVFDYSIQKNNSQKTPATTPDSASQ